jgi:hypothetical protein
MAAMTALLIMGCGGKKSSTAKIKGIEMDSVKADSVLALEENPNSPTCKISISMQYVKGDNANKINNAIIRSGLLIPEYFSLSDEKMTMKQAVDSFISTYMRDYKTEYGKLYREDKGHPEAFNCEYSVRTCSQSKVKNVLTYIAEVYTFGGGAHGISQTIVKNFDVKSGRLLSLNDFFRDGYEEDLKDIITEKIAKKFGVKDLDALASEKSIFADKHVYVPNNFIPADDKITFIYCSDEIAPHSFGEIRIDIDKSDIKRLLKK